MLRDINKITLVYLLLIYNGISRKGFDMSGKLEGKVAVITGGSSGIGLATAQRFVSEGAYVFITGRRQSELDAAVKKIGKNVTAVQGDVSNLADLDRLYAKVKEQKGRIDIVFANAGMGELASIGCDFGGAFRQDLWCKRERNTLHSTEGAPAASGRWFNHTNLIDCRIERA